MTVVELTLSKMKAVVASSCFLSSASGGKDKNGIVIEEDRNGEEEDVAEEVEKLHVGLCAGVETTLSGSSLQSEVGSNWKMFDMDELEK